MRYLFAIITLFAAAGGLTAQGLGDVAQRQDARLADALVRLHAQRQDIQAEELPLLRRLNELDALTTERERELAKAQRVRDEMSMELNALRERVDARQRELDHAWRTTIPGYVADFEAMLSVGERAVEGEAIREYNLFLERSDVSDDQKLDRALQLVSSSLEHATSQLGGKRYEGKALTPDRYLEAGQFLQVGPLLYFVSEEGSVAGVVDSTAGLQPQMHPLDSSAVQAIKEVASSGRGALPVDLSLGDALAFESVQDSLGEHLKKGGIWVYPILLFALVSAIVAVIKSIQIFSIRHPDSMEIHELVKELRSGNRAAAHSRAEAQPQPARDMLVSAVDHSDESTEMVEEVMYEAMLTTQPRLEKYLNVIAVTAAAAPLLGLLGTVTGIIKTFQLMTIYGAGDPKPLISGISEALITTELGLVLAIPALVLHALLSRKLAGIMARLEKTAIMVVNGLSRRRPNVLGESV